MHLDTTQAFEKHELVHEQVLCASVLVTCNASALLLIRTGYPKRLREHGCTDQRTKSLHVSQMKGFPVPVQAPGDLSRFRRQAKSRVRHGPEQSGKTWKRPLSQSKNLIEGTKSLSQRKGIQTEAAPSPYCPKSIKACKVPIYRGDKNCVAVMPCCSALNPELLSEHYLPARPTTSWRLNIRTPFGEVRFGVKDFARSI